MKQNLLDLDPDALTAWFAAQGEKPFGLIREGNARAFDHVQAKPRADQACSKETPAAPIVGGQVRIRNRDELAGQRVGAAGADVELLGVR